MRANVHSIDNIGLSLFVIPPAGSVLMAKVPGFSSDNLSIVGATPSIYDITPRSMRQGRVFTEDGRLVASYSVQAIIRPFVKTPEQMGLDATNAM